MNCTRCEGTGFINLHQIPEKTLEIIGEDNDKIVEWINNNNKEDYDVSVCDCCGDTENWYGEAGSHYCGEDEDFYRYNGGRPECY